MSKTPLTGPSTTPPLHPSGVSQLFNPMYPLETISVGRLRQTRAPTLAGIAALRDVCATCSREPFVIYKIDLASLAPAFISKLLDHPHPRPDWLLASLKSRGNLPGRARSIAALRPRLSFHSFRWHSCSWRLPPLAQPDFSDRASNAATQISTVFRTPPQPAQARED